ncbi:hypothetical protein H2203_002209 [Taxawa tesnikishii (nom. ined.)]|nr:hypothetical protein H2203_002209 [Dothideales sp. JES 119]
MPTKLAKRDWNVEPTINFKLPLLPTAEHMREKCYTRERMQIWKDNPEAINMTSEIPPPVLAQLKYVLGVSNSLAIFRADPLKSREILRNAPRREEAGYQPSVDFADAYPIHMLGLSSVRAIHPLLPKDDARSHTPGLDALRFRANIYLTGASAFAEDHWKQIRVGDSLYHVSCRTARCALVNVDQKTGEADRQEPLKTLIEHRQIDEGARPHSCLGMQVVPLLRDPGKAESIRVGDVVEVMETGGHFYLKMFA